MADNSNDVKNGGTGQDPRIVLEEVMKEIKDSGNFGRREAIFMLLDELLREQLAEIN